MSISYSFSTTPDELVAYLKNKKPELHFDYDEIMYEAHHKAFTVAKVTKLDLLSDIQEGLKDAMEKGKPFKQWQEELKPTLQKYGWWGEVEVTNPATGEVKNIFVGSRRLKNIFDTNMRVAYAQGRYESQMQSEGEYFYYSAILDAATRPAHARLNGLVLPKNDPWWDTNYPPNAWHCRCKARVYTKEELERRGSKPNTTAPQNIADNDWAYHVGKKDNITKVYEDKINSLTCKSKNAKDKSVECGFLNAVKEEFKENLKYIKENQKLFDDIKTLFVTKEPKKVELCKSELFGDEKRVLLSSDTVQSHLDKKEITAFDYTLIPKMLQGDKKVFRQKENVYILLKKLGKNYRLALKNMPDTNEIYVANLLFVKDYEKEIRKLSKYKEE